MWMPFPQSSFGSVQKPSATTDFPIVYICLDGAVPKRLDGAVLPRHDVAVSTRHDVAVPPRHDVAVPPRLDRSKIIFPPYDSLIIRRAEPDVDSSVVVVRKAVKLLLCRYCNLAHAISSHVIFIGVGGGTRTRMVSRWILSPLRLPISPRRQDSLACIMHFG